jgi:hypothetical protein
MLAGWCSGFKRVEGGSCGRPPLEFRLETVYANCHLTSILLAKEFSQTARDLRWLKPELQRRASTPKVGRLWRLGASLDYTPYRQEILIPPFSCLPHTPLLAFITAVDIFSSFRLIPEAS